MPGRLCKGPDRSNAGTLILLVGLCLASSPATEPLDVFVEDFDVGDVNNDGVSELVVTSPMNNAVIVYDAAYRELARVSFSEAPRSVVIADVDRDTTNELVVATSGQITSPGLTPEHLIGTGADGGGFVYVGELLPSGAFQAEWTSPRYTFRFADEVAVGDLNRNGRAEIIMGLSWYDRRLVSYEWNDTTFVLTFQDNIGSDVGSVVVADSLLVVGTGCWSDYGLRVYRGYSLGYHDPGDGITYATIGDVNGDDTLEVVRAVGCRGSSSSPLPTIWIYGSDNSVVYTSPVLTTNPSSYAFPATGEMVAGGGDEIAVGTQSYRTKQELQNIRMFQRQGSTYQEIWRQDLSDLDEDVYHLAFADLNRDGQNELLVSTTYGLRVYADHDAGVDTILVPQGVVPLDTALAPRAVIRNHGFAADSFHVLFRIGTTYVDTVFVSLQPAEAETVSFALWHATQRGTFVVACSTMLDGDQYPRNDKKTGSVTVSSGQGPEIYSITPNRGGNTGRVTADMSGRGFGAGSRLMLRRGGDTLAMVDSSLTHVADSLCIVVTMDLAGLQTGAYDLVLATPSGETTAFYSGFAVEAGRGGHWSDVIGRDRIRRGSEAIYRIRFGNTGNNDIENLAVDLTIPENLTLRRIVRDDGTVVWDRDTTRARLEAGRDRFPEMWIGAPAGIIDSVLEHGNLLWAPTIRAGHVLEYRIVLCAPPSTHGDIQMNPDYFVVSFIIMTTTTNFVQHFISQLLNEALLPPEARDLGRVLWRAARMTVEDFDPRKWWNWIEHIGGVAEEFFDLLLLHPQDFIRLLVEYSRGGLNQQAASVLQSRLQAACQNLGITAARMPNFNMYLFWTKVGLEATFKAKVAAQQTPLPTDVVTKEYMVVTSWDPNDKAGPTGFGTAGHVPLYEQFQYVIYFENMDTATAPAEDIVITDTLDSDLDWTTFAMDTSSHPITNTNFNPATGVVTWRFEDINLPPNRTPPEGEGWLSYTINPKPDLPTGTEIRNRAWIVFDVNPPMATRQVLNTIDAGPPSSTVVSMPEDQPLSSFAVQLAGADDQGGSGIRSYDIYVSDNDSGFVFWKSTESTSVIYTGVNGHTYKFYSVATDNVGHVEDAPTEPDAVTAVRLPTGVEVSPNPFVPSRGHTVISFFGAGLSEAEIKVFNKAGELVKRLTGGVGADRLDWGATSEDGRPLATGVYIYTAREASGTLRKGKFAIIR